MLTMEPRCFFRWGSKLFSLLIGKLLLSLIWKFGSVIDLLLALNACLTVIVFGM